jgi:hypothetical protein
MHTSFFNVKQHRWWAMLPLIGALWRGIYTVLYSHPDYLLFVCYTANILLGVGILMRWPLLIGAGFGWTLIGFPLWMFDVILNNTWELSATVFHTCGLIAGLLALRHFRLPKYTWVFAEGIGLLLYGLARLLTDETLNVNAAFRVYEGWEGVFSNYPVYVLMMLVGYGAFFFVLPYVSNRFLFVEDLDNINV